MAVAQAVLAMREETLRQHQMQIILGPGHSDIEQPSLLLDFMGLAGAEIRGHAAIDDVEHEHGFPFLTLGGVDG